MKKIIEETLNAIQENVRTRETQELDYKRDNLFKGSWKDFKIKDLKPNLIPDGWDSFEPYGNEGEETRAPLEVFDENYAQNELLNGDFRKGEHHWSLRREGKFTFGENGVTIESPDTRFNHIYQEFSVVEGDVYYCNVEYELNKKITMATIGAKSNPQANYPKGPAVEFGDKPNGNSASLRFVGENDNKYLGIFTQTLAAQAGAVLTIKNINLINLTKNFGEGNEPSQEWCDNNLKYYANWEDLSEQDKPVRAWDNMAIHYTPLEDGLTRIQTWGGNNRVKLRSPVLTGEFPFVSSMFLENKGQSFNIWTSNRNDDFNVERDFSGYIVQRDTLKNRPLFLEGENLDFIASDPQIVEGDVPNPVMIVTPLDDGREHVQVYGATKDTKLVYSGNEGFIGEDYGLKTTIENNGIDLDLSTSLTEEKKRIEKGENKVNLQGELSTKLSIEIGVPSE